jgi:hypothetical protein
MTFSERGTVVEDLEWGQEDLISSTVPTAHTALKNPGNNTGPCQLGAWL